MNLHQGNRRRGDHLRERGEVEDCVLGGRRGVSVKGETSEGLTPQAARRVADLNDSGGERSSLDCLADDLGGCGEATKQKLR